MTQGRGIYVYVTPEELAWLDRMAVEKLSSRSRVVRLLIRRGMEGEKRAN